MTPPTTHLWLAVHFEDALVRQDRAAWTDAAALMDRLATRAEEAGARLCLRVGETFARLDAHHFLMDIEKRGHEVGWLAPGERVREAMEALAGAGFADAPRVGSAGLGRVPAKRRRGFLLHAQDLGLRILTDEVPGKDFAYQGWLAWERLPGLVSLDPSVDPVAWGARVRRGDRVVSAQGRPDWHALAARIDARDREIPPPWSLPYFGAWLAEEDLCAPGTLLPTDAAWDGLGWFLDRYRDRLVHAATAAYPMASPPSVAPARPWATRLRQKLERRRPVAGTTVDLDVDGRRLTARRIGPERPRGVLVVVHGGRGDGIAQGLGFVGLRDDAFAADGVAVWLFDRSETERHPGNPFHVADTAAVLSRALAEGRPTGVLTASAGLLAALPAVDERVAFLVDAEGPVDRWSAVPAGAPDHDLAGLDPLDDAAWAPHEAIRLIGRVRGRYQRLQGQVDHVHGMMHHHARRIVDAAERAGVPWARLNDDGDVLPGRLWEHGATVRAWILDHFAAAGAR